jgi:hypothetical protein
MRERERERERVRERAGERRKGGPRLTNWEPSSQVSAPNVRKKPNVSKEDAEKKKRPKPLQTRPHFILQC